MSEHTKEPWKASPVSGIVGSVITAQPNENANAVRITSAQSLADAERIVACVNACAGIPDQALKVVTRSDYGVFPLVLAAVIGQRDELAAALRYCVNLIAASEIKGSAQTVAMARTALASLERAS
ncbi:hypothetical protein [Panacagrimonas sp.]|uniref:hypothetical protein n=1 Tax=Panacagrimonas sp. TaxID=2480088 RepID=UPI003B5168E3